MVLKYRILEPEVGDLPTSVSLSKTIFIKFPAKEAVAQSQKMLAGMLLT